MELMLDFEYKELKPYKGYDIQKCRRIDSDDKRIKKYPHYYLVADDEDYISEELLTLSEAKRFIDGIIKENQT